MKRQWCDRINSVLPGDLMLRRCHQINSILPDDLMLKIFRYLDWKQDREASSLVCRRWLSLVRLSRETICIGLSDGNDAFLKLLSDLFVNVKHVHIDESPWISPAPIYGRPSLINQLPLIGLGASEYGESTKGCLSDSGLATIEGGFTKLASLRLIWCPGVTDAGIISLVGKCKLLKSLDLQVCCVGDKCLAAIAKYCTHLEDLNLKYCNGLTDTGFVQLAIGRGRTLKSLGLAAHESLSDVSFQAVGLHCISLETLSIESEFISNKGLLSIAKGCSLLKSMKLHCQNITDDALQGVGNFCPLLEILTIRDSKELTDKSLLAIGKGCKKLKNLSLTYCYSMSDLGLDSIAVGCPELVCFKVDGCSKIGIDGVKSIGKACIHLSELALVLYGYQRLNFNPLRESGIGCKYLQSLHLFRCSDLGDEALHDITRECRNLKKLNISSCRKVGNEGLISVGRNCKFLSSLIIRYCSRVGDAGITAIAKTCSQLSFLDVKGVKNLGDKSMAAVGEGCPLLKDLKINSCPQISDTGLSYIAKNCKLLESCNMLNCYGISRHGVETLITCCPIIKKVSVEDYKYSPRTELGVGHGKIKLKGQMWSSSFMSGLHLRVQAIDATE